MAVQTSSKKWMFIGGGVIVAAGLVVFFQNYPPSQKDAEGTIGGAQRYHSTQITGTDVKVDETELTTWIQSDTFDRIVKDPQARKLFTDAAVMQLFLDNARNNGVNTNLDSARNNGVGTNLDSARNNGVGTNLDSARNNGVGTNLDSARNNGVGTNLDSARNNGVGTNLDSARNLAAGSDAARNAMQNPAILDALRNQAFCQALSNANLRTALVDQARSADANATHD